MKFIPATKLNKTTVVSGVYKLIFDNKWFYIGSSVNLYNRQQHWRSAVNRKKSTTINISYAISISSHVRFKILEECDIDWIRLKETDHLIENWGNYFILNVCPDGNTTKGLDRRKEIRPVYQLTENWEIERYHKNYALAAEALKCTRATAKNILKKRSDRLINGFRLIFVDEAVKLIGNTAP